VLFQTGRPLRSGPEHRPPPNPRLQRTRSASPPSPLSRQPLGGYRQRVSVLGIALGLSLSAAHAATPPERTRTPVVVAPVLVKRVEPSLPKGARQIPISLEAVITKDGDVQDVRVTETRNHDLDRYYVGAVSRWKYKPATLDGKPVAVMLTITITVSLHD
jgi:TonB-like protein